MPEPGDLARKLAAALAPRAAGRAATVVVGLTYTAAMLEDGRAGVAYTFRDQAQGGCSVFGGKRPLAGQEASTLLALATSRDPIEAAVGLAVAGALLSSDPTDAVGDVLDHLDLDDGDTVGMVGYFGPLVPEVRRRVERLVIFERVDLPQGDILPQERAVELLAPMSGGDHQRHHPAQPNPGAPAGGLRLLPRGGPAGAQHPPVPGDILGHPGNNAQRGGGARRPGPASGGGRGGRHPPVQPHGGQKEPASAVMSRRTAKSYY